VGAGNWRDQLYGRLTGAQLERCLACFSDCWSIRNGEIAPKDEVGWWAATEKLMKISNWTPLYQDTLVELIAKITVVAGFGDQLIQAAASNQPIDALLDALQDFPDQVPEHPAAMPLAFAMIGNLDAIARYSRSINDMLRACRENGDIEALFDALSVDSYISTMPFFQAALRLSQLSGDADVAEEIFNKIKGPHKKRLVYPELRWAEYLLRDQGAFEACTQNEIHQLIVDHLKLYDDDSVLKDSKKSLFMLFRKWRKEAGI
jgi:hypothetical protein